MHFYLLNGEIELTMHLIIYQLDSLSKALKTYGIKIIYFSEVGNFYIFLNCFQKLNSQPKYSLVLYFRFWVKPEFIWNHNSLVKWLVIYMLGGLSMFNSLQSPKFSPFLFTRPLFQDIFFNILT